MSINLDQCFEARSQQVAIGVLPAVSRPKPTIVKSFLAPEHEHILLHLAEFPTQFPASKPLASGRRLYADCKQNGPLAKYERIKMKGGGGLKLDVSSAKTKQEQPSRYLLVSPNPDKPYGDAKALHLFIGPDLRVSTIESNPKADVSLSEKGAIAELNIRQRLGEMAQSPLLAAKFILADGSPEKDYANQTTGVVFSKASLAVESLSRHMLYFLANDLYKDNVEHIVSNDCEELILGHVTPEKLRANYFEITRKIGELRATCFFELGVSRHAFQVDNFDYERLKRRVLYSDLDSAILLDEKTSFERAGMFLRDISSDLTHLGSELTYQNFTRNFYLRFSEGKAGGFTPYLKGLFKDALSDKTIEFHCRRLEKAFFDNFYSFLPRFAWMHSQIHDALVTGVFPVSQKQMQANWYMPNVLFTADALSILYDMMNEPSATKFLASKGIVLAPLPRKEVVREFQLGTLRHFNNLNAEAKRVCGNTLPIPRNIISKFI